MNTPEQWTSLGQQRIPQAENFTDWLPKDFHDDNFFLDSALDQLTPEEERLFRSFGDGLDSGLGPLEACSEPLDERQVVYAEAHAAGLFKGGIRRAAFSMGDLQALQPPELPALIPSMPPGSRPPLPPAGSSKPPRLESVPESKALATSTSPLFGSDMLLSSRLSGLSTGGLSGDGTIDNQTLDQLSADLAADLQSSFDPSDVPMPLFSEQRQGRSSMGGMSAAPSAVKLEPGEPMMGMFPTSAPPFPAVSSGATMYNYPFHDDSKKVGMMPNKVEGYGSQGFPSDSTMELRGFADTLLTSSQQKPPQPPKAQEKAGHARRESEASSKEAEREREKEQQRQRMLRRSRSAVELRGMGNGLARHGSTPDLQQHVRSSGLVELTNPEGQTYTAGRLSNEERAQKILRYRQKRHERNFNKRIKYMCRKTLADSRPRVRGRFARNDDSAAVMPHETKKALAEKARKEKKANAQAAAAQAAAAAAQSQDMWGGGGQGQGQGQGPMLTGQQLAPGDSFQPMIPNNNSSMFGGDYFGSANSNCYTFPSLQ